MANKRQKTSRQRRTLIGAIVIAGVIMAGSTFAWFTSKDEVTNRLSASAEYGVAVGETFQPPENWVPGQEINKDASAVNTGNVDAFVRMWLTGDMRLLSRSASATTGANVTAFTIASTGTLARLADVTDTNLTSMGLTKLDATNSVYYKTLEKTQTLNPGTSGSTDKYGFGTTTSGPYSEVQAMQGGRLAYTTPGASYAFVLKQEADLPVWLSKNSATAAYETVIVPKGTLVIVNAPEANRTAAALTADGTFTTVATSTEITPSSGAKYTSTSTVYVDTLPFLANVEYETFTPLTNGLYLWLRNEADTEVAVEDLEFSGYYVADLTDNSGNASTGTYYALNTNLAGTNRSDYTVKAYDATTSSSGTASLAAPIGVTIQNGVVKTVTPNLDTLELFSATYSTVSSNNLKWFYDDTAGSEKIYAAYIKDDYGTGSTAIPFEGDEDIVVEITLANILASTGTAGENWKAMGTTNLSNAQDTYTIGTTTLNKSADKLTFYYCNDVEAGDSTKILVDKVTLYSGTTQKAYLAFDFDLNVNLESVQVTFDENGNEKTTAVEHWAATGSPAVNTGANATSQSSGEINAISWGTYSAT